jgi:hypothetical protein
MVSILQLDGLGKRYGMLPSQVLSQGNTFDLYVMDMALTFENYHNKKAMNGGKAPVPEYSNDELLDIFNKGKERADILNNKE